MKNILKQFLTIAIEYITIALFITIILYVCLAYSTNDIASIIMSTNTPFSIIPYILLLTFLLLLFMKYFIRRFGKKRFVKKSISKIDKMTGEEFEKYLGLFFEKKGFKVEYTPKSNDYGADLILYKKDELIVVQAKRYDANVGNAAIQEVVAAKDYYEADRCIVITNSYFTRNATCLAEANNVELWDRDIIEKF